MKLPRRKNVALVYDDLVQWGGGENFFIEISKLYPNADIYCPIVSKKWLNKLKNKEIFYSKFLSNFLHFGNFGYYLASVISIIWFESLNLYKYDIVISLCNRFSGVVITKNNTKHVCIYTHPARQIFTRRKFSILFYFIRLYLFYALKRADVNISISNYTKLNVKKYLNIDSIVIPPIVNFSKQLTHNNIDGNYFLIVGRCTKWKMPYFNKALKVFKKTQDKIIVVGEYFDKKGLVKKYKNCSNIQFVGRVSQKDLNNYYKNCIALIHPQVEDFGLTPLEALTFNKPIVCYKGGGVLDYLTNEVALFYKNNFELKKALKKIKTFNFNKTKANKIVNNHSPKNFSKKINLIINNI